MAIRWYKEQLPKTYFYSGYEGTNLSTGFTVFQSEWALSAREFWVYVTGRRGPDNPIEGVGTFPSNSFTYQLAALDDQGVSAAFDDPNFSVPTTIGATIDGNPEVPQIMNLVSSNSYWGTYRGAKLFNLDTDGVGPFPAMGIQFFLTTGDWPDYTVLGAPNPAAVWCTATVLYKIED